MTQSNITRQFVQDPSGTLHAGVDLSLEKNVVVVVNEKAERLDHFSFPQDREGYDCFLRRLEGLRQKHQAAKVVVAMEPTNYFWKLLARDLEEKQQSYRLVNAYTVKKHREGDQLDLLRLPGHISSCATYPTAWSILPGLVMVSLLRSRPAKVWI